MGISSIAWMPNILPKLNQFCQLLSFIVEIFRHLKFYAKMILSINVNNYCLYVICGKIRNRFCFKFKLPKIRNYLHWPVKFWKTKRFMKYYTTASATMLIHLKSIRLFSKVPEIPNSPVNSPVSVPSRLHRLSVSWALSNF